MDDTVKYLAELKKKYVHQVEHIIDDWDFQSLPPDSRRPFLEEEIISEIVDDVAPEANAISSIQAPNIAWFGLSLTQELTDLEYNTGIEPIMYQSYEQHLVSLCTRANGITGVPEPELLARFLQKSSFLNVFAAIDALFGQLDVKKWQVRCKALVLMKTVLLEKYGGALEVPGAYLRAMRQHPQLLGRLHRLCVEDRNARVRDEAWKLRALIQVSGGIGSLGKSAVGSERMLHKNRPSTLLRTEEVAEPFKWR
uniref:Uncharacterized protein AlNc14C52G4057 n=1 Tax=Albugo laibachii Nc14 TaxID=890382 RepID=F0WBL2_9STRA|nr:cleavage induced hypothetical protein [Albugo laibachii Nc14]|eukprot:CCA18539.1 cleavage induced hypothetical protein [Albugo laibachii Nc14]